MAISCHIIRPDLYWYGIIGCFSMVSIDKLQYRKLFFFAAFAHPIPHYSAWFLEMISLCRFLCHLHWASHGWRGQWWRRWWGSWLGGRGLEARATLANTWRWTAMSWMWHSVWGRSVPWQLGYDAVFQLDMKSKHGYTLLHWLRLALKRLFT